MKNGRMILKGKLDLLSPMMIGNGKSDICDRDVLLDSEAVAYIPATSFLGVLSRHMDPTAAQSFLGQRMDENNQALNQSYLICDDLFPLKGNSSCVVRDGIRIDKASGVVEDAAKFDFQVVEPGICFELNMEFVVTSIERYEEAIRILENCLAALSKPLYIGGKTSSGFGCLCSKDLALYKYDFDQASDLAAYLLRKPHNHFLDKIKPIESHKPEFSITADFMIPQSLIVRSYPKDAFGPDASHIQSADYHVLPGTSLRGALRARGERILNVLWADKDKEIADFLASIFGYASTAKGNHYSIPSSLRVGESRIEAVVPEIQNRICIDRFTGGTIQGAKFDSMPVFPLNDTDANIRDLSLSLADPLPSQKALLLLIFKDLYTGDLPVGGEKSIGRGTLLGMKATIKDESAQEYGFEQFGKPEIPAVYAEYMRALLENSDYAEIQKRLAVYR